MRDKKLRRSIMDRKICGVCGGIAEFFEIDPTLVRVLWAILSVVPGTIVGGILIYVIVAIIMPEA